MKSPLQSCAKEQQSKVTKSRGLTDINGVIGIIGLLFDCIENKTIKVVVEQSA
jgi:hypothetical protein